MSYPRIGYNRSSRVPFIRSPKTLSKSVDYFSLSLHVFCFVVKGKNEDTKTHSGTTNLDTIRRTLVCACLEVM